jgi:hypothetical protein
MNLRAAVLFAAVSFSALFAQQQVPAPPVQSARQALTEMLTGGQKAVAKHLTVEVQQLLAKSGNKSAVLLAPIGSIQSEFGPAQTFESGPVLLLINRPREHSKLEVRIENDDLSGDEDTFDLSLHVIRESSEQPPEDWEAFLSRLTVNMKKQAGIWRLNKIGVGVEFPLGDPEFLKKTVLKPYEDTGTKTAVAAGDHVDLKTDTPQRNVSPRELVFLTTILEQNYAQQHPDIGFTCSLADLMETAPSMGLEQQLSDATTQGYKLSLSGCQGKPAGSFQIVAEPTAHGNGGKAYCADATRNVRVADDGRGSTCLTFGRVPSRSVDESTGEPLWEFHPEPRTEVVASPPR